MIQEWRVCVRKYVSLKKYVFNVTNWTLVSVRVWYFEIKCCTSIAKHQHAHNIYRLQKQTFTCQCYIFKAICYVQFVMRINGEFNRMWQCSYNLLFTNSFELRFGDILLVGKQVQHREKDRTLNKYGQRKKIIRPTKS